MFLRQTVRSRKPGPLIAFGVGIFVLLFVWVQETAVLVLTIKTLHLPTTVSAERALNLAFLGYTVFLLFSSVLFTLNALLLHPDLDLLLAAPWPVESVLAAKILGQAATLFAGVLLLTGPGLVVAAALLGQPAAPIFLLTALAVYPVIPVVLISLLLLGVVRFIPQSRAREVMAAFGILFAFGINALNIALNPGFRGTRGRLDVPLPNLPLADAFWLPSGWAGRAAARALTGEWAGALFWEALLLAGAAILFAAGSVLAGRLYLNGWAQSSQPRSRHRGAAQERRSWSRLPGLHQPVAALVAKDWRVRRRDLAELARLAMPLGMLGVLFVIRGSALLEPVRRLGPGPLAALAGIGPALLALTLLSQALGLTAVSLEGKALWIYRSSPNSMRRLLEAKCWAVALPVLALALPAALLFEALIRPGWIWAAGALAFLAVAGVTASSIMVALGGLWARFDWTDARRMLSPLAGLAAILAQFVFLGVTGALVVGPVGLAFILHLPLVVLWVIGLALGSAAAVALAAAALVVADLRLQQLEVG